jgi:hypothetical protein
MVRRIIRGITLVDLAAIISVALILATVFTACGKSATVELLDDIHCKNNLKAFSTALALYKNAYDQQYPDVSGLKFVAMLYRTGFLIEKQYYICPAKEKMGLAEWTDATYLKFWPKNPTTHLWPPGDWKSSVTFLPAEISYAGRRNDPDNQDDLQYRLSALSTDPTPLIADHTLNRSCENSAKYAPHDGAIHVLLNNNSIIEMKDVMTGEANEAQHPQFDLSCLSNKG